MTWEYKVASGVPTLSVVNLNDLGREGWELVTAIEHAGKVFFYFKRPVG
jgi:hypothetical protein